MIRGLSSLVLAVSMLGMGVSTGCSGSEREEVTSGSTTRIKKANQQVPLAQRDVT